MERLLNLETKNKVGEKVLVAGSVVTRRDHGKLVFLDVVDRSGKIQIILNLGNGVFESLSEVSPQSAVAVEGVVKERSPQAVNESLPTGKIEIEAQKITILSHAAPLPFDIDTDLQIETYLDNSSLTLRSEKARAIFKVQSIIAQTFTNFFTGEGFIQIQTPKIVASATEGGTELFEMKYFADKKAYLAQSPQLYKQIMVGVFERVFEIAPVFRNEPHSTTRHINEYVSLDIEMAFIKDHYDVIDMANKFFSTLIEKIKDLPLELALFEQTIPKLPKEIPVVTLLESQEILKKEYNRDIVGEPDLEPGDERMLGEYFLKNYESDFVWIIEYPTKKRPFYTMPKPDDPDRTRSYDLLFRGMEIISGAQRINDYDQLVQSIKSKNLNPDHYQFYLEAFKYGMPPEGGFAIGLERLTARFLGINNIRYATLFPRDIHRLTP